MASDVYMDYAATAAVRPDAVIEAVAGYLRDVGASPGRGAHRRSVEAGRVALRCRLALARLLGIPGDPGRIAFQWNATHALNTALSGVLRRGDVVVRTALDHNAVRRPVHALRERGVREVVLPASAGGTIDLDLAERVLRGERTVEAPGSGGGAARLLVLPHASNVLGTVLPVRALAERARASGALVLLDAAQSVGHVPLAVDHLGVDLLAFSGHKGLLGPQGTGALWVRDGIDLAPSLLGGTGGDSGEAAMPEALPDRLEAGTQNGPGIAGLLAGVEWVAARGVEALHGSLAALKARLRDGVAALPGARVHSPAAPEGTAIVTLTVDGVRADELARRLDRDHAVLARAGLHCAPETHALLGTEREGALRLSLGWATTEAEVDRGVAALRAICGNAAAPGEVHRSDRSTSNPRAQS